MLDLSQGVNYARNFENGLLPPIHLSITMPHPVLITTAPQRGAPKGTPLQIGKSLAPYYGFTENVQSSSPSEN
jgi:hypothetical protein